MVRKGMSDISGTGFGANQPASALWNPGNKLNNQSEMSSALIRQTQTTKMGQPQVANTPHQVSKMKETGTENQFDPQAAIHMSGGTKRTLQLLKRPYELQIDSAVYSKRQGPRRVGNYYNKMVNELVFQGQKPTPLLSPERSAMIEGIRRAAFGVRNHSVVTTSMRREQPLEMDDSFQRAYSNRGDTHHEDSMIRLPRLIGVLSQDNLLEHDKKKLDEINQLLQQENSSVTDNRQTAIDTQLKSGSLTQPQSTHMHSMVRLSPDLSLSKIQESTVEDEERQTALRKLAMAESMLHESQLLDPRAGNMVINQLNAQLHDSAQVKIHEEIERKVRERERMRRRRDLGGEKEIEEKPDKFYHQSVLEEVEMQSSCTEAQSRQETESLANSSIYNLLADPRNRDEVHNYVQRQNSQLASMSMKSQTGPKAPVKRFSKLDVATLMTMEREKRLEQLEQKEMMEDPDAHFKKLKAKIKLKAVKLYQEDLEKKEEANRIAQQPVVEIKDKYGRTVEKQKEVSKFAKQRRPATVNRKPIKRPPPQRLRSFTELQLKYALDVYNPINDVQRPTLTDLYVINVMKECDRYPVPESLVGRRKYQHFNLKIDSIMSAAYNFDKIAEWANYELDHQDTQAPYNSMESEEEFDLYDSQESDEMNQVPYIPKAKLEADPSLKAKQFDVRILHTNPYRIESMRFFPYRSREGEIPKNLLQKRDLLAIFECHEPILNQQKTERWSKDLLQNIFEHYCIEMKAAPVNLSQFYNFDNPNNKKLQIKNFQLDEQTVKALCLVIPYLLDFNELELFNNQMSDIVSACVVFSFFMNPHLKRLTIAYNYMRLTLTRTLSKLLNMNPDKLTEINLMGSINFHDHIDPFVRTLPQLKNLITLNIAGCSMQQSTCRMLHNFMISSQCIRNLDVSHCRISFQGSRYIIDALNRNVYIRNFNFSHNDLNSSTYEFSIKIASILTRHPSLIHIDITNTNIKREELMFIGLSIPISKTLLSIHLTAAKLPYYERIFLRAMIAARVQFQNKNHSMKKDIRSNRERNQVLQIASGEVHSTPTAIFVNQLKQLDEKRQGLDFEISDMLAEMDTQTTFKDIEQDTKIEELPKDSKVGQLVDKIVEHQKQLELQQAQVKTLYSENTEMKEYMNNIAGVEQIEAELYQMYGNQQTNIRKPEHPLSANDLFEQQKELRVERARIKKELEVQKEGKDRSAGELALMFMGINQVAYELLLENPMTGYMNEIIFSRVLGHDEIEEGHYWVDSVQCWFCNKWNKCVINYHQSEDKAIFLQKAEKITKLHSVINATVADRLRLEREKKRAEDEEIQSVAIDNEILHSVNSSIEEADEELEKESRMSHMPNNQGFHDAIEQNQTVQSQQQMQESKNVTVSRAGGQTQRSGAEPGGVNVMELQSKINDQDTEARAGDQKSHQVIDEANIGLDIRSEKTAVEPIVNPHFQEYDTTNPISPMPTTVNLVEKMIYPEDYSAVKPIRYRQKKAEEIYGDELKQIEFLNKPIKPVSSRRTTGQLSSEKNKISIAPVARHSEALTGFSMPPGFNSNPGTGGMNTPKAGVGTPMGGVGTPIHQVQRQYLESKEGGSSHDDGGLSSVISHHETKRRKHGEATIIQRQVFFQGVVYMIEEELYSDSDHSSVYTSEDEFEHDRGLLRRFKQECELKPVTPVKPDTVEEQAEKLQPQNKVSEMTQNLDPEKALEQEFQELQKDLEEAEDQAKNPKKSPKKKDKQPGKMIANSRHAFAQVIYAHDKNLTEHQKLYEPKNQPKYYKPRMIQKRIEHFRQIRISRDPKMAAHYEKYKNIFVCTSFNDWMPKRMKTQQMLMAERYPADMPVQELPNSLFSTDDKIDLYAEMVPPGYHYFYFVHEKGQIFLSPKFEVVRFKSTNIFLNRVHVKKRLEQIETVFQAKDGEEDEAVFMKDRSVFKDFKEDTEAFLKKCFEEDVQFSKIHKTVGKKSEDGELKAILDKLFENYQRLNNIFLYYSGTSSYPTISMNDFTSFASQTKILDKVYIGLTELDLLLVATCVSINIYVNSAEKDLQRYEFLEMIVRLANFRYKEQRLCDSTVEAIDRVFNELIYPNAQSMDGDYFRRYHCYTVKTNEVLKKNEMLIKRVYDSYTHAKKRYITMPECQSYVRKLRLRVSEMMVGAIYAESMMTIIDTIRDQTRPNQMKFVEFIVFLCRISFEHFNKTEYEDELLHLKINALMPLLLSPLNMAPLFLFEEKFKLDQEKENKRMRRKMSKIHLALQKQTQRGEAVDPKQQEELLELKEKLGQSIRDLSEINESDSGFDSISEGSVRADAEKPDELSRPVSAVSVGRKARPYSSAALSRRAPSNKSSRKNSPYNARTPSRKSEKNSENADNQKTGGKAKAAPQIVIENSSQDSSINVVSDSGVKGVNSLIKIGRLEPETPARPTTPQEKNIKSGGADINHLGF